MLMKKISQFLLKISIVIITEKTSTSWIIYKITALWRSIKDGAISQTAHKKCEEFTPRATCIQTFFKAASIIIKLDEHVVVVRVCAASKSSNSSIPYSWPWYIEPADLLVVKFQCQICNNFMCLQIGVSKKKRETYFLKVYILLSWLHDVLYRTRWRLIGFKCLNY